MLYLLFLFIFAQNQSYIYYGKSYKYHQVKGHDRRFEFL